MLIRPRPPPHHPPAHIFTRVRSKRTSRRSCHVHVFAKRLSTSSTQHKDAHPHWPHPISSSGSLTHLKSTFQAYATAFHPSPSHDHTTESLEALLVHLRSSNPRLKRVTHCMYAYRHCYPPLPLPVSGDIQLQSQSSDGGESGAGERLLRLLELGGYKGVIVVVYRWYGGVQLGSGRWKFILGLANDALKDGGFKRKSDTAGDVEGEKEGGQRKKGKR